MACYWVCFGFLAVSMKSIPVRVAYAIWSGVGIIALICVEAIGLNPTTNAYSIAPIEKQKTSA